MTYWRRGVTLSISCGRTSGHPTLGPTAAAVHGHEGPPSRTAAGWNKCSAPASSPTPTEKAHLYRGSGGQRHTIAVTNPPGFLRGGVSLGSGGVYRWNEPHPSSRE